MSTCQRMSERGSLSVGLWGERSSLFHPLLSSLHLHPVWSLPAIPAKAPADAAHFSGRWPCALMAHHSPLPSPPLLPSPLFPSPPLSSPLLSSPFLSISLLSCPLLSFPLHSSPFLSFPLFFSPSPSPL